MVSAQPKYLKSVIGWFNLQFKYVRHKSVDCINENVRRSSGLI